MIDKYEIRKIDGNETLFIYINVDYEFSLKDFNKKSKGIKEYLQKYIKEHKIAFRGNVVNIIVGGFFIGSIILNNGVKKESYHVISEPKYIGNEVIGKTTDDTMIKKVIELEKETERERKEEEIIKQEEERKKEEEQKKAGSVKKQTVVKKNTTTKNTTQTSKKTTTTSTNKATTTNKTNKTTETKVVDNNIYINLNRGGKVEKIELEEYIIGVVGAEMPASFHIEALKSQAIISRTYALKARSKGKTLSDNESNQSYKSNSELKALWGANYNTYYNKIKKAVNETKGMYLAYNGGYIEAVFHSTSNGKTESSVNVWGNSYPYLVSVESKYDNLNSSFTKTKKISYSELSKKLGFVINQDIEFNILGHTSGNRVSNIKIGDKIYTGVKLRNLLGLRSADFTVSLEDDGVVFTTSGYGHGVGLSQYGANGYAKNGLSFEQILLHYYPGVTLKSL